MTLALDATIAAVAARQHHLMTVAQLRDLGIPESYARRRVASGSWWRLARGVVAVALAADSWRQRLMAACLSAGAGAAASHRAAGVLQRMEGLPLGVVELVVPVGHDPRGTGGVVHRSADPVVPVIVDDIPCTPPERTLVDLGAVVTRARLEQALDSALRLRTTTLEAVEAELASVARPGRAGVGPMRRLLDDRLPGTRESRLETLFDQLVRAAGLPAPVSQLEIQVGGRVVRADFAYPQWRILIELDGAATHSGRTALDRDLARQNALVVDWLVLRFTWTHVVREPEYVVATILAAIEARSRVSA